MKKAILIGILAGAVIGGAQLLMGHSYLSVYRGVELGMPNQEAMQLLTRTGAKCNHPLNPTSCEFGDSWRIYHVKFRPDSGAVYHKFYRFRRLAPFGNPVE